MNRDEQRDRPPALHPRWRALAGELARRAIWPTDPRGGGTWIGAGEHGLVLCLLNLNAPGTAMPHGPLVSRGSIIPRLIGATRAEEAIVRLGATDFASTAPFRLVAVEPAHPGRQWNSDHAVFEASWDGAMLRSRRVGPHTRCFVSSGLGDALVAPRQALFGEMVAPASPAAQDVFHAHEWPDRPEISVRMSREEACTVSVTTVEVTRRAAALPLVRMAYQPVSTNDEELAVLGVARGRRS